MRTGFQSVFILETLDNLQKLFSVALVIKIRQCVDYKRHNKRISMPFFFLFTRQYIIVTAYKVKQKAYHITKTKYRNSN